MTNTAVELAPHDPQAAAKVQAHVVRLEEAFSASCSRRSRPSNTLRRMPVVTWHVFSRARPGIGSPGQNVTRPPGPEGLRSGGFVSAGVKPLSFLCVYF